MVRGRIQGLGPIKKSKWKRSRRMKIFVGVLESPILANGIKNPEGKKKDEVRGKLSRCTRLRDSETSGSCARDPGHLGKATEEQGGKKGGKG